MSLTVAVQMDPIQSIKIAGDSTFALLLEAQARGHRLLHYTPDRLSLRDGRVITRAEPLQVRDVEGDHAQLGAPEPTDLSEVDVVLLRQDPPFDMAYITTTHILELIHPATLVVNDPAQVRNAPEKLFVMGFPHLMPPTLITRDREEIEKFRAEQGDIVMKPLYGNGGAAVFKLARKDPNFGSLSTFSRRPSGSPGSPRSSCPRCRKGTSASSSSTGRRRARSTGCRRATTSAPTWCAAARRSRPTSRGGSGRSARRSGPISSAWGSSSSGST